MSRLMQLLAGLVIVAGVYVVPSALIDDTDPVMTKTGTDTYLIEFKDWQGNVVELVHKEKRLEIAVANIEAATGKPVIKRGWKTEQLGSSAQLKTVGLIVTMGEASPGTP